VTSLAVWLATRSREQLATLITRRSVMMFGPAPRSLGELADQLLDIGSINAGLQSLTEAAHQVIRAAATLATEIAGLPRQPTGAWGNRFGYQPIPNDGIVNTKDLLVGLGAGTAGPARAAALELLRELEARALLWPHDADTFRVPGPFMYPPSNRRDSDAGTVDQILTASFNKEPVGIIAEALGVGVASGSRNVLQAGIVAYLADAANVRALIESAPVEARDLLQRIMAHGGVIGTTVFPRDSTYQNAKHTIATHYPDAGSLWLARHGLILPTRPDRGEVPAEVRNAVGHSVTFPFAFEPPTLPQTKVVAARARGEAQAAAAGALAKVSALVEAVDKQPVSPRKTGGLPVRETRRLAKALRLNETETRFWLGLTHGAGLIGVVRDGDWYLICPTTESDHWLDQSASERLAQVLRAWFTLPDVITWWPYPDETPVALAQANDPDAPVLRATVLSALAALPPGSGCLHATAVIGSPRQLSAEAEAALDAVTRAATWFAPLCFGGTPQPAQQVLHTLYEAELLGVAAHGALTEVGRALLARDEPALLAALKEHLPAEQATARFQADMTVVVTGTPSAHLATLLGSMADRESEGHAVVYRISATTVRRALDAGAEAADLLAQLAEVAEGKLPQPLTYMIKEVGRAHGKMRVVRSACCIRCDDDSLVAELAKSKALTKLGLRRIAPTVLISVKSPTETLTALRLAGFSPTLEAETGVTVVERDRGKRSTVELARPASTATPQALLALAQRLLTATPSRTPKPAN
jgi:hypothetical protein